MSLTYPFENTSNWRLLPPVQAPGNTQMAIDRWLLQKHHQGKHPPTLRFYTWQPTAISLGYHQRRYPSAWNQLTWQGQPIDIVRRPTGGRAVLHQGDLTYMVVTSGIKGKTWQVYQEICQFLVEGWHSLGVNLSYGGGRREYIHNPSCFGTSTGADLIDQEGNKLIGSAQLRQGDAILQHGSIPLSSDRQLFEQVFGESKPPSKLPLPENAKERQQIVLAALQEAAQNCFGIKLISQPLSESEWEDIK